MNINIVRKNLFNLFVKQNYSTNDKLLNTTQVTISKFLIIIYPAIILLTTTKMFYTVTMKFTCQSSISNKENQRYIFVYNIYSLTIYNI